MMLQGCSQNKASFEELIYGPKDCHWNFIGGSDRPNRNW